MVSYLDEVNRFAYIPKDWADELSSQHRVDMIATGHATTYTWHFDRLVREFQFPSRDETEGLTLFNSSIIARRLR